MLDLTSEFIATLPEDQNLDVAIRECHARKALELLANGEVEIGIIRFRSEYRDYFEEQMTQRGLNFEILSKYRYQILLCRDHPLAQKSVLQRSDLADLPEIVHGDTFRQSGQPDQHVSRKIYTVDRLAQLSLLEKLPNSYMWASAMPERCLRRWGFVQKICSTIRSSITMPSLSTHSITCLRSRRSCWSTFSAATTGKNPVHHTAAPAPRCGAAALLYAFSITNPK